jgi:hypothetical protein
MLFRVSKKDVDKKGSIKCPALNTLVYFSGSKQISMYSPENQICNKYINATI